MKTALLAFVLSVAAPMRLRFTLLGVPVSIPVLWLVVAAEVLAVAVGVWLIVRALRGYRRPAFARTSWGTA